MRHVLGKTWMHLFGALFGLGYECKQAPLLILDMDQRRNARPKGFPPTRLRWPRTGVPTRQLARPPCQRIGPRHRVAGGCPGGRFVEDAPPVRCLRRCPMKARREGANQCRAVGRLIHVRSAIQRGRYTSQGQSPGARPAEWCTAGAASARRICQWASSGSASGVNQLAGRGASATGLVACRRRSARTRPWLCPGSAPAWWPVAPAGSPFACRTGCRAAPLTHARHGRAVVSGGRRPYPYQRGSQAPVRAR